MNLKEIFKEEMEQNVEIFYIVKNEVSELEGFHMKINRFRPPYTDIDFHTTQVSDSKYIGKPDKFHTFVK